MGCLGLARWMRGFVSRPKRPSGPCKAARGWGVKFRDGALVLLLALGVLTGLELVVRGIAPQTKRTTVEGGVTRGIRDPELGHLNRPATLATVSGPEFEVEYRINGQGMRDSSIHPASKADSVVRILVLGDSFAFGSGNPYHEIWPVLFEEALRSAGFGVEVMKGGVPAYDTRLEALYLERIHGHYRPDVVVLAFLPNDLFTNAPIDAQPGMLSERQGTVYVPHGFVRKAARQRFQLHTVLLIKAMLGASDRAYVWAYASSSRGDFFREPVEDRVREQYEVTKGLLRRAARFSKRQGTRFVVLSIPQQAQVLIRANRMVPGGFIEDLPDKMLSAFAAQEGFSWIETLDALSTAYRNNGRALYHRVDGHLNEAGNRMVAEVLSEWMMSHADEFLVAHNPFGDRCAARCGDGL